MTTAKLIADKLEDFGLENITEDTTVFVSKDDASDVEVADSEFNTFTKAYATCASYLIENDGDSVSLDHNAIRNFVETECQ